METLCPGDGRTAQERARSIPQAPGSDQGGRLSPTDPQGDLAVVYLEAQDIPYVFEGFGRSQEPFDVWFRQQVKDIHGLDFSQPLPGPLPLAFVDLRAR